MPRVMIIAFVVEGVILVICALAKVLGDNSSKRQGRSQKPGSSGLPAAVGLGLAGGAGLGAATFADAGAGG